MHVPEVFVSHGYIEHHIRLQTLRLGILVLERTQPLRRP